MTVWMLVVDRGVIVKYDFQVCGLGDQVVLIIDIRNIGGREDLRMNKMYFFIYFYMKYLLDLIKCWILFKVLGNLMVKKIWNLWYLSDFCEKFFFLVSWIYIFGIIGS